MAIKLDEFSTVIQNQIKKYSDKVLTAEEGKVITIGDGIAKVSGLDNAMLNEILIFENGTEGMALNLEEDSVGVVMLGEFEEIQEGDRVVRSKRIMQVPVGDALSGRVVNAIGQPIDGKGKIKTDKALPIEKVAPGVMTRKSVNQPLETGMLVIDAMFPIGKGQRELIIGDRQTGKTTVAIDAIINQKGKNVRCVYVAVGQKNSTVASIVRNLENLGAMAYTTIVSATAADLPALKYIAPFAGVTMAEYWMSKGEDVLIIYDDLSKHAVAYRTLSLLLRRPPGREAYPGDVFYLHSRLLERACRLNKDNGGGSITALPIIETQAGDISAYIPTNVISITDGQLFMMTPLFNAGQRPAVDAGLSVSRVGGDAQIKSVKQVGSSLRIELASYRELDAFSQFGSDLDSATKKILDHGKRVMEIIKQPQNQPYHQTDEAIILFTIKHHMISYIPVEDISRFKSDLVKHFKGSKLRETLEKSKAFNDALVLAFKAELKNLIRQFLKGVPNYSYTKDFSLEGLDNTEEEKKALEAFQGGVETIKTEAPVATIATKTEVETKQETTDVSKTPEAPQAVNVKTVIIDFNATEIQNVFTKSKKALIIKDFKDKEVKKILFFSKKDKTIIGEVNVKELVSGPITTVYNKVKDELNLPKDKFTEKFSGSKTAHVFLIDEVKKFDSPKTLADYNLTAIKGPTYL